MTTYSYRPGPTRYERLDAEARDHLKWCKSIAETAQREGRDLTESEQREAQDRLEKAKRMLPEIRQAKADDHLRKGIADLGSGLGLLGEGGPATHPRLKAVGGGDWGTKIVESQSDRGGQYKALLPAGAVAVSVPLAPEPVRTGEPVLALRQLLPTVEDTTGRWSFMRQTVRTSNADVVAPGALKPTSVFSLERIENRSRTIAHLSEGLQRQDLDDAPMLREFIDTELRLGLEVALEDEIINGDGTGEHFDGLANVSGTQSQAFATDLLHTTRAAITKLEVIGLAASGFVFAPADWEKIELSGNDFGYALAQAGQAVPVDRAARRLWGVPVAVSTAVPVGTGYVADFAGSTELHLREDARVDWSENVYDPNAFGVGEGATDWSRNILRFRAELRAGFDVKRPAGIVEIDLAA